MTPELRHSVAQRAREIQRRLNDPAVDPLSIATDARRIFEDAGDVVRTRWMHLELGGYGNHVSARPLHAVLDVPTGDRLAAHVAAYRTQVGFESAPNQATREFRHFFVESLVELVAARDQLSVSPHAPRLMLQFGTESATKHPLCANVT